MAPCGCPANGTYLYQATHDDGESKWKPSIHLPKKASRVFLEVLSIQAERLQAITEESALAEGVKIGSTINGHVFAAKELFQGLWDSINGQPKKDKPDFSWNANPWVWATKFKIKEIKQYLVA